MANVGIADKLRIAGLVAGATADRAWTGFIGPLRRMAALSKAAPERLLISPQDIRTTDPTVAADIYSGFFAFAGRVVNTHGKSPFELVPPSPAWAAALASFNWLRHLRAADTALAHANARALIDDWITLAARNPTLPVRDTRIAARRLLAWLSQSPMILDGADGDFYRRFMKALGRHAAFLESQLGAGARGETRLLVAMALSAMGLCAADMERLRLRATRLLAGELTRQILPDGGHVSRNPQALIDLLLDLLPLRQTYAARGVAAPPALINAIDRMLPMLRLLRRSDGTLALFNGMGITSPHLLATVLAYDDARASAPLNAPHSGYQRLEAGPSILIMDTGAPPPTEFSARAHAGQLSFELSSEGQAIFCNCGAPDESRGDLRQAARSTAAHSTLTIADTSSSRFAADNGLTRKLEGRIVSGPKNLRVSRQDASEGPGLVASHDGYARAFGVIHERALRLAADGASLAGSDRLYPASERTTGRGSQYALRFHLHPAIRAKLADDGRDVALNLPDGGAWRFEADGMPIEIEPGISFASVGGARGTDQIVIHARSDEAPIINWRLLRDEAAG